MLDVVSTVSAFAAGAGLLAASSLDAIA